MRRPVCCSVEVETPLLLLLLLLLLLARLSPSSVRMRLLLLGAKTDGRRRQRREADHGLRPRRGRQDLSKQAG